MRAVVIRPETPEDYAAIGRVHCVAFGGRVMEAMVVALQRQRVQFDPSLSLVAERDGQVIGHVLFSPHTVRLLGQDVPAVSLAPIAVDPARQGEGIGGRLIAEGHAVAQAKGYQFSFLLGHTSYYPRFGYRTNSFGVSSLEVPSVSGNVEGLERRPPTETDVPALQALWLHEEGAVDFALAPGDALLDWLSPNPAIRAWVFARGGSVVGYARVHTAEPDMPRVFLAENVDAARGMAAALARDAGNAPLVLPLHPGSASAAALGAAACVPWEAAMACALGDGLLDEYLARVGAGERQVGRLQWPVAFDLE